jgi:hypothetical protein
MAMKPKAKPSLNKTAIAIPVVLGIIAIGYIVPRIDYTLPQKVELNVPYASQAPEGKWVSPWDESCEEATTIMVDAYYNGDATINTERIKKSIINMVAWETAKWKIFTDTDAAQTVQLISAKSGFIASIKRNPLLSDIKAEIANGRPVIFMHDMHKLYVEPDLGDSYHVSVITGYDDATGEFIVNDPARPKKRYSYEVLMNSLHDFNPKTGEADLVPTVLFTSKP